MANLTSNKARIYHGDSMEKIAWPLTTNIQVFSGGALMPDANGYAQKVTPTASGRFLGFACEEKDNRTGSVYGGSAGNTTVEVWLRGILVLPNQVKSSGNWAGTDVGAAFYAADDDTFTDTAGTNNIQIGKIVMLDGGIGATTSNVYVYFESSGLRSV